MNTESIKEKLVYWYFISLLFESICLYKIGSFSITITFLFSTLLLLFSIISITISQRIEKRRLCFLAFAIGSVIINCMFAKGGPTNFSSVALHLYYILLFSVSAHKTDEKKLVHTLSIFNKLVFLFSIYAIYQFVAYNFVTILPFKEIIPEWLLTPNYNTIAKTYTFGLSLYRAHSIFLEPSLLSQYTAIAMLFLIIDDNLTKKRKLLYLITYSIAFVTSLSGTGAIILLAGFIYIIFNSGVSVKKKIVIISSSLFMLLIMLSAGYGDYYINRLSEISIESTNTSGYYRFVLPYIIGLSTIQNNFFGYGLGNDDIAMLAYNAAESRISSGYGKIFAEMGILGLCLLLFVLLLIRPRMNSKESKLLFLIVLILNVVSANFVLSIFWCFALLLNTKRGEYNNDKIKK